MQNFQIVTDRPRIGTNFTVMNEANYSALLFCPRVAPVENIRLTL